MIRISAIAEMCQDAEIVYDVCCDHGLIGKSILEQSNKLATLNFIDCIPSIIDKLEIIDDRSSKFIARAEEFDYQPNSTLVIAGIGAYTAIDILDSLKHSHILVLCIHQNVDELRQYLFSKKFQLIEEKLVKEKNKFYEIIKLRNISGKEFVSEIPNALFESIVGQEYLKQKINYYSKKMRKTNAEEKIILQLMSCLL